MIDYTEYKMKERWYNFNWKVSNWWYDFGPAILAILIVGGLIFACFGVVVLAGYMECQELQGGEHVYKFFTWGGCKILSPNGFWIDVDSAHLIDWMPTGQ